MFTKLKIDGERVFIGNEELDVNEFRNDWCDYCNRKIDIYELLRKYEISRSTLRKLKEFLINGHLDIKYQRSVPIPENFKEEYMKYYNKEQTQYELLEKFNLAETTFRRWRNKLNLPIVDSKTNMTKDIPENFKEEYMKCYNKKKKLSELSKKFNASVATCIKWRDKLHLPRITDRNKSATRQANSNQETSTLKEHALTLKIFNYEIRVRNPFEIRKVEDFVSTDDFDDFVEY